MPAAYSKSAKKMMGKGGQQQMMSAKAKKKMNMDKATQQNDVGKYTGPVAKSKAQMEDKDTSFNTPSMRRAS